MITYVDQKFYTIKIMSLLRIATRNSPLALWQANFVKQKLEHEHPDMEVVIVSMTTEGDQLIDRSLSEVGGKALFLKELEVSLLNNETDIAVHSMKDVPVSLPQGLGIAVVCERADPRDALVSNNYQNLYALPDGAKVGTSSQRRIAQLKNAFPQLEFVELRGNVNTRLARLDDGDCDAIILAAAGLIRLGFIHRIKQFITPELCLPAVGQGTIGIECRSDDDVTKSLIRPLHCRESALYLSAERAMNAVLDGGCQSPIGGYAEVVKGKVRMRGMVGKLDGSRIIISNMTSENLSEAHAKRLGQKVASDLIQQGAGKILNGGVVKKPSVNSSGKPVVILTRQAKFLGNMASILETLGFQSMAIETQQIEPVFNEKLLRLFRNLDRFTDIVFVSRNAIELGMSMIQQQQSSISTSTRVMAVGAETAKHLYKYGIDALFPDHGTGADALLSVNQLSDLTARNILVVRGAGGIEWPAEEMRNRGAEVEHADVYIQKLASGGRERFDRMLTEHNQIHGVFLHSATSATNFMHFVKHDLERFEDTILVVGSERIGAVARKKGWQGNIRVAQSPSNKHMMITFSDSTTAKPVS